MIAKPSRSTQTRLASVTIGILILVGCSAKEAAGPEIGAAGLAPATLEQFNPPVLEVGRLGTLSDLDISEAEIGLAVRRLQVEQGFIALISPTFDVEYHFTVARAARQAAEDLDLPIEVFSSQADPAKAVTLIDDVLQRGAAVIIIDVFDSSILPALDRAIQQGVFIVQYAGRTAAESGAVTISIEDADLGMVAGEYAGRMIVELFGGQANVVILDFPSSPQVVLRAEAIRTALLAAAPQAVIVGNYREGTTEFGFEATELALTEHPEINVVVSINDAGAYGAFQVMTAAGRTALDTLIVGIDGERQALEYIGQGTMYRGTVDTAPLATGSMSIQAAVKLLAGSRLLRDYRVPVQLITAAVLP